MWFLDCDTSLGRARTVASTRPWKVRDLSGDLYLLLFPAELCGGLYERLYNKVLPPHRRVDTAVEVSDRGAVDAREVLRVGEDLGLYPVVTSQHNSTTLYQVSYHIQ
jgi:hypothetical protein